MDDARLLTGARVVTPTGVLDPGWLLVTGDTIAAIGAGQPPPGPGSRVVAVETGLGGHWVVPGFVDIHCHGGGGVSFAGEPPDVVAEAVAAHRGRGTTTLLASLVSRPVPDLTREIAALAELVDDDLFAGLHLEGPFLAEARCGAHDPAVLRPPDPASVAALLTAGRGGIRMITVAPELDGALTAIKTVADAGVLAAIGHTDATEAQVRPAVEAGATIATHLYNGMRPLHHREPGPVGALLDDDRVTVELICDLVHLHPTVVRLAARTAGRQRVVAVTDAMAAAGAGDGSYRIGELAVDVRDGVPILADTGALAGSVLTMDAAFANLVQHCGFSMSDAVVATATRPAELLGLDAVTGSLVAGRRADLVVLNGDLAPAGVMHRGRWVGGLPLPG